MSELIFDPLAQFDAETAALESGVKDPVTGIRQPVDKAEREAKRNEEIKRRGQVTRRIITQLMEQDLGREWLYDLLTLCNVFGTPYTVDPQLTAYNAGAMIIGRTIEGDIKKFASRNYFLMLEEGWNREKIFDDEAVAND